ncbi:MAG TPA: GNVR domain-containing protein [Terriglobales bacterium]|nr:GNVR domain-containing protein [Terriglobales bacterium]
MPDDFEDKSRDKPDLREYWRLARRRCWYFFLPLFGAWLVMFSAGWLLPSVYRSGTLILVEQPTVPQQYVVSNITGDLQNRLDSISQQILSRTRLLHIIEMLNLYKKDRGRLTPDDLVERMRKDIDIELVRSPGKDELTAFNISFSASDPHTAQAVTSELTTLFISENLEVRQRQSANTTQFLGSQLEEARRRLAEQEKRVREYKDKYLGELPTQLESNIQILSGFQNQLTAEQDALGRAKQQNTYLESLLAQYRSVETSVRSADAAPMGLPAIDQELERLHAQMADLSSHYTEKHPDIRKLKEQIAKTERMKQQIAADLRNKATAGRSDSGSTAEFPEAPAGHISPMMEVQSQLKANQIEIANRQQTVKELKAKIGEYQGRLNQTPVREQQLADLSRDYDQSRTDYESLLGKKNQSELATNLEKRQEGENFRILDPPSLPTKPYSPNRFKLTCIGLFAGIVLGIAGVAGAEFTDDRIYSEKEFKKLISAEFLTQIPPLVTPQEEQQEQRAAIRDLVGVFAVTLCILAGIAVSYWRS